MRTAASPTLKLQQEHFDSERYLTAIRRRGCSGAAMFEKYMVCRCDQDMYLPAVDDETPVQKNLRCDRRARAPAFSRNPASLVLTYAAMITR
jgi:hypothetical protein